MSSLKADKNDITNFILIKKTFIPRNIIIYRKYLKNKQSKNFSLYRDVVLKKNNYQYIIIY